MSKTLLPAVADVKYKMGTYLSFHGFLLKLNKIRFGTHDNIGSGPIHLPPDEMHTSSSWLSFSSPSKWTEAELTDAMTGAAYAMNAFIPLFIQCDSSDVAVVPQVKATHNEQPTFFVYDKYPGGIGLSEKVYDLWEDLVMKSQQHVINCPCKSGCPSCIGAQESIINSKSNVVKLFQLLNGNHQ